VVPPSRSRDGSRPERADRTASRNGSGSRCLMCPLLLLRPFAGHPLPGGASDSSATGGRGPTEAPSRIRLGRRLVLPGETGFPDPSGRAALCRPPGSEPPNAHPSSPGPLRRVPTRRPSCRSAEPSRGVLGLMQRLATSSAARGGDRAADAGADHRANGMPATRSLIRVISGRDCMYRDVGERLALAAIRPACQGHTRL
jgi:hypothetical protein